MIEKLAEMNVLNIVGEGKDYIWVEDTESYAGGASIYFDENGNVKEVTK